MKRLARPLLAWYRSHRRRLPWRERPEPYRVWVSELMLQQTQVSTVIPYFERFVERFPDIASLAAASEQEVLAAWSGLGYYRRAKALHRAAKQLVEQRGGGLPGDLTGWLELPGVGRYTAGAILSIAFGKRVPILDGNVERVLSRVFLVRGDPKRGETQKRLWSLAEDVLPTRCAGDFNQALMELGALVCTPKAPRCLLCPLQKLCEAHRAGVAESLPELAPRPRAVAVKMAAALIKKKGRMLMYQRRDEGLMQNLWEFPMGECQPGEEPEAAMAREAQEKYGLTVEVEEGPARLRHSIMNRRITLFAFRARLKSHAPANGDDAMWIDRDELSELPVSSMVRKVLRGLDS